MAILLGRGKSWRKPGDAEDVRRDEGDINTPAESYKDGKTKIFIPNNLSAFNEGQMVFSSAKPKLTQTFLFFFILSFGCSKWCANKSHRFFWPRAELDLIRLSNLTNLHRGWCNNNLKKKSFCWASLPPLVQLPFFSTAFVKLNQTKVLRFFFSSSPSSLLSCASLCSLVAGLIYNTWGLGDLSGSGHTACYSLERSYILEG